MQNKLFSDAKIGSISIQNICEILRVSQEHNNVRHENIVAYFFHKHFHESDFDQMIFNSLHQPNRHFRKLISFVLPLNQNTELFKELSKSKVKFEDFITTYALFSKTQFLLQKVQVSTLPIQQNLFKTEQTFLLKLLLIKLYIEKN